MSALGRLRSFRDSDSTTLYCRQSLTWMLVSGDATKELGVFQRDPPHFGPSACMPSKWAQIDLVRKIGWIAAEDARGGEDIHISLSDFAMAKHAEVIGALLYDTDPSQGTGRPWFWA